MDPHQFTKPPQSNQERHLLLQSLYTTPKTFRTINAVIKYVEQTAATEKTILEGLLLIHQKNLSVASDEITKILEQNNIQFLKVQISLVEQKLSTIKLSRSATRALQIVKNWNGDQQPSQ